MRADSLDRRGNTKAAAALRADTVKQAASEQIFGLSIFRSVNSEFQPNTDGPVDANYKIGPGDKLVLILTGQVELAHTLDVTREGFIVIPQVGQLAVANLTLGQLESLLYDRLGRVYSGVRRGGGPTRFSISVAKLRSNQVFVVGDVEHPGSVRVSSAGAVKPSPHLTFMITCFAVMHRAMCDWKMAMCSLCLFTAQWCASPAK